jgi:RNA polymerase sigma factor (sigma-70 family)
VASDAQLVARVRRGDASAFEALYDRHARELLSFCRQMLGSQQDAEDAVQSTFAAAYHALRADERAVMVRPWLFAIARNDCLSLLRKRRPIGQVDHTIAGRDDPALRAERRDELRDTIASLQRLPEPQRAALVLSQLHGFSHSAIAELLGVRGEQVKAYVYQARSNLISDRQARAADCRAIREELAMAHGAALLKSQLRRHLRACPACREYSERVARQRRTLGGLLPAMPSFGLKRRVLDAVFGRSSDASAGATAASAPVTAASVELFAGGAKALLAKLLVAVAGVGAAAVGTVTLAVPTTRPDHAAGTTLASAPSVPAGHARRAAVHPATLSPPAQVGQAPIGLRAGTRSQAGGVVSLAPAAADRDSAGGRYKATAASTHANAAGGEEESGGKGKSGEAPGHNKGEGAGGKGASGESHGKSGEAPGHNKGERAGGKAASGESHGKSGQAPGHEKSETTHGSHSREQASGQGNAPGAGSGQPVSEGSPPATSETPAGKADHGESAQTHTSESGATGTGKGKAEPAGERAAKH